MFFGLDLGLLETDLSVVEHRNFLWSDGADSGISGVTTDILRTVNRVTN